MLSTYAELIVYSVFLFPFPLTLSPILTIKLILHDYLRLYELRTMIDTIVVPQGAEYQAVCRGLELADANLIQVITIPIGNKNIGQILASYSQQLAQSQRVLIMGLCGSLAESYNIGDGLLIRSCLDLAGNQINLDLELTAKLQNILSVEVVTGLTSDRIITQAKEKLMLSQQYPVSVVEMEGYGYVAQLQQQGISVAMLRVVSDGLTGDLPDLSNAIDHQGDLKVIPTAIAFLKQPIAAMRLIRGSLTGLKTLEQMTAKLFVP